MKRAEVDGETTARQPSPGSPGAVARGCTCPVLDNVGGRGAWGDGERYGWWLSADCPLHGDRRAMVGTFPAREVEP